jgi:hypothetical protein
MSTGRRFQNGHHNTAQIQRPELIPDIEKFLPVAIFTYLVAKDINDNLFSYQGY